MSETANTSPRIEKVAWGYIEVEGVGSGKDFKLWPGGGRPWDWNETGTRHAPGIQPADVAELLEHGCEEIVLSKGMYERLQTDAQTIEYLKQRGVKCHIEETKAAVDVYNELAERGINVGGLFHCTC